MIENSGEDKKEEKKLENRQLNLLSFAFELGYSIAIPIILLALLGRFADKYFNTSPWLLLGGILLSILISSAAVYQKIKKIFKEF